MVLPTMLYDAFIDQLKLTEQKNSLVYSSSPTKSGRNNKKNKAGALNCYEKL